MEPKRCRNCKDKKLPCDTCMSIWLVPSWHDKREYPLLKFMTECGITTMEDGQALWKILANRDIEVNGVELENGTWRYNGGVISEICGGDYMNYYCNSIDLRRVKKIWKIMKKHGAVDKTNYNRELGGYWYEID